MHSLANRWQMIFLWEARMGFTRERVGNDGQPRYVAMYRDLKGRQRSAGTFASRRQADKAWQRAEVRMELGRTGDPRLGRQTFRQYAEKTWLPNHEVEVTTRQNYTYVLYKHLMPEFGTMRMMDIMPMHVREWVTGQKNLGLSPATIAGNKVILSAIFTTALNDQVTVLHPCKGDPAGAGQAADHHHARAIRRAVRGDA
jgi:Phage integrase, N-terminal SAM-like domain